jgi:hypothetical protein
VAVEADEHLSQPPALEPGGDLGEILSGQSLGCDYLIRL